MTEPSPEYLDWIEAGSPRVPLPAGHDMPELAPFWNHRIVLERHEFAGVVEETFSLREVHYNGDGTIRGWTENPIGAVGDSWRECVDTLAIMGRASGRPVIDVRSGDPVEMPLRDARRVNA